MQNWKEKATCILHSPALRNWHPVSFFGRSPHFFHLTFKLEVKSKQSKNAVKLKHVSPRLTLESPGARTVVVKQCRWPCVGFTAGKTEGPRDTALVARDQIPWLRPPRILIGLGNLAMVTAGKATLRQIECRNGNFYILYREMKIPNLQQTYFRGGDSKPTALSDMPSKFNNRFAMLS